MSLAALHFPLCISISCHTPHKSIPERLIEACKWGHFAQDSLKPHVFGEFISINVACGGVAVLHIWHTHECKHTIYGECRAEAQPWNYSPVKTGSVVLSLS